MMTLSSGFGNNIMRVTNKGASLQPSEIRHKSSGYTLKSVNQC